MESKTSSRRFYKIKDNLSEYEIFKNNEIKTNKFIGKIYLFLAIFTLVVAIVNLIDSRLPYKTLVSLLPLFIVIKSGLFILTLSKINDGRRWIRFLLIHYMIIETSFFSLYSSEYAIYYLAIPTILASKYFEEKTLISSIAITIIFSFIVSIASPYVLFQAEMLNMKELTFLEPTTLYIETSLQKAVINSNAFDRNNYFLQQVTKNLVTTSIGLILLFIVLYNICLSGNNSIINEQNLTNTSKKNKQEFENLKIETMISQIQPHFLYNTLNSIYYLIDKEQDKAKSAILDFSDYLRTNLNFNKMDSIIPFKDELKQIERYLNLEKMRFEDELEIEYDIKVTSFKVPSLSIQPLVENAVKHGITKRIGGGKLIIRTEELTDRYLLSIIDNGIGFDMTKPFDNSRAHIGLENAKFRLENQIKAIFTLESEAGVGTKITIKISKENYYEDPSSR